MLRSRKPKYFCRDIVVNMKYSFLLKGILNELVPRNVFEFILVTYTVFPVK